MALTRILAAGALAALLLAGHAQASAIDAGAERESDRAKGSDQAPVTIIEYASVACGACAEWHEAAMPTVQTYIDSGDVRLVFREVIAGPPSVAIAGFMLADCAPDDQYFDVIDALFDQQGALFTAMQQGRGQAQFETIARSAGFSDTQLSACLQDEARLQAVRDASDQAERDGVTQTPTFFINGQRLASGRSPGAAGPVFTAGGEPIIDAQGPIPATVAGETFERIILYYKARAEGSSPGGGDGGAE